MSYLATNLDLRELWRQRSEDPTFKLRDQAYRTYENAYLSRTADGEEQNITWRPIMMDGQQQADTRGRDPINLTKSIGLHHTAASARPPHVWNEPGTMESETVAEGNTARIQHTLALSGIKLLQTKQANNLAVRGDAVYGIVWDQTDKRRPVRVRIAKPDHCYPAIDDVEDLGLLRDILITYTVRRGWAEQAYGITIPSSESSVHVFEYWDDERRLVQIEKQKIPSRTLDHRLGFVPWYWCFNQVPGMYAQADVAETPKMQGIQNELLILAQDAVRKTVDKAFYAIGYKGTITPTPGKAVGFPNPNTKIGEFPTAAPPELIMQMMGFIQDHAQSMAGISPISSEGMAQGSIVTGAAVRHQVEAIEARTEAKRTNLEAAYAWIGETILRVIAAKLRDQELTLRIGRHELTHSGSVIGDWTRCLASYGSFEGLDVMQRGNWAMQGLGRVHGRRTAIALAYPERDVEAMEHEIDEYQVSQARLSAQAQTEAQQVLQSGQSSAGPGAGSPGGTSGGSPGVQTAAPLRPLQMQQAPPAPGAGMFGGRMSTLSDLKLLVKLTAGQLRGDVYATGEIAVTGMAVAPDAAVTREEDLALVRGALSSRNVTVRTGVSEDEPKVQLNDAG
jgi:hypothetical protein